MNYFEKARTLLKDFKGDSYRYGNDVLQNVGNIASPVGKRAVLVHTGFSGSEKYIETICTSLEQSGITLTAKMRGVRPNAPREDLARLTGELKQVEPEVLISFGGGSTIDAAKAADVLRILGGEIDDYFGTGLVTRTLQETGKTLTPHIAIQTVASSAAHLTKYSNITDLSSGQKKLIVDEAIVPPCPVFDYAVTQHTPPTLTADGALDGVAHILEVFYG